MTHLVIDNHYRVIASGTADALRDDFHASLTLGQTRLVDVDTADVATLANIAQVDSPRLAAKGTGMLGAGTHPAQPYLEIMLGMHDVGAPGGFDIADVRFGYDDAQRIVITFLSNASTWRGDTARLIKARLKGLVA